LASNERGSAENHPAGAEHDHRRVREPEQQRPAHASGGNTAPIRKLARGVQ
jgi:hypothetical protein